MQDLDHPIGEAVQQRFVVETSMADFYNNILKAKKNTPNTSKTTALQSGGTRQSGLNKKKESRSTVGTATVGTGLGQKLNSPVSNASVDESQSVGKEMNGNGNQNVANNGDAIQTTNKPVQNASDIEQSSDNGTGDTAVVTAAPLDQPIETNAASDNLSIKMITDHFSPDKKMIPFKHMMGSGQNESLLKPNESSLTSETPINSAAIAAMGSALPGAQIDSKVRAMRDLAEEIRELRKLLDSNPSTITNTVPYFPKINIKTLESITGLNKEIIDLNKSLSQKINKPSKPESVNENNNQSNENVGVDQPQVNQEPSNATNGDSANTLAGNALNHTITLEIQSNPHNNSTDLLEEVGATKAGMRKLAEDIKRLEHSVNANQTQPPNPIPQNKHDIIHVVNK